MSRRNYPAKLQWIVGLDDEAWEFQECDGKCYGVKPLLRAGRRRRNVLGVSTIRVTCVCRRACVHWFIANRSVRGVRTSTVGKNRIHVVSPVTQRLSMNGGEVGIGAHRWRTKSPAPRWSEPLYYDVPLRRPWDTMNHLLIIGPYVHLWVVTASLCLTILTYIHWHKPWV